MPGSVQCPRLADAASLPLRPGAGVLRGDVDGDSRTDRVTIRQSARASASCGFLLVVDTGSRVLAARVHESYKPRETLTVGEWPFAEPYVAALVSLGGRGLQIVLAREHGASNVQVSLHGVVGGRLVQLRLPDLHGWLSLFGSVGTGETMARCSPGGPLVLVSSWPANLRGTRWSVSMSEYRLVRDAFVRTSSRILTGSPRWAAAQAHRWGIDAMPFSGCTVARGRRL